MRGSAQVPPGRNRPSTTSPRFPMRVRVSASAGPLPAPFCAAAADDSAPPAAGCFAPLLSPEAPADS